MRLGLLPEGRVCCLRGIFPGWVTNRVGHMIVCMVDGDAQCDWAFYPGDEFATRWMGLLTER